MDDMLAPTWHKKKSVALELMAFQNRKFYNQLNALVDKLYKEATTPARAQAHPARLAIEKLVHDTTGAKIKLHLNTPRPPMVMPVLGNSNHVLSVIRWPGMYLDQEVTFLDTVKKAKKAVGGFDAKNGKLTGIYTEIETPIWMSWDYCTANFSPIEFAAVLMHEVGHASLAFQFMFRTYRASQFLAALHQVRTGRDTSITYEQAIKIAGEELTENAVEFEKLVEIKNDKAIATIVYSRTWAQLGNDFGDESVTGPNFEALADNYAGRWGYAEALATSLYTTSGQLEMGASNRTAATVMYVIRTLLPIIPGGVVGAVMGGLGGFLGGVAICAVLAVVSSGRGDSPDTIVQSNVYDTPLVRMQRIRESIIEQLKLDVTADMRETLLEEFKIVDKLIANRVEIGSLWAHLALVFPRNWKASAAFDLERDLEQLANNELFVGGQELFALANKK